MFITFYSFLLSLVVVVTAPWWLWRMATTGRYREGLAERLGLIPPAIKEKISGKPTIWLHAVSVGEVLAAERLIAELQTALPGYVIAISTTTATGQKIARERFPANPVFYFPLDFAFAVRPWLHALKPSLVILVESEFWPRHLVECERAGIPVAVVNARISDRSFPRYLRLRRLWKPLLAKISLFLAQGEESAQRLRAIGAPAGRVQVSGNLKGDYAAGSHSSNALVESIAVWMGSTQLIVAGSTHDDEEALLLTAWPEILRQIPDVALMIAPRHPERFNEVFAQVKRTGGDHIRCSQFLKYDEPIFGGTILLLDTIGDLASMYRIASAAFVGGSLVPKGGQNPLEPARLGIPVVMGPYFENFREIVESLIKQGALTITDRDRLSATLIQAMTGRPKNPAPLVELTAATKPTIQSLLNLLPGATS